MQKEQTAKAPRRQEKKLQIVFSSSVIIHPPSFESPHWGAFPSHLGELGVLAVRLAVSPRLLNKR
jgi:hypothetical protein